MDTNLGIQHSPSERLIEKGNVNGYNEDLGNCIIKEEVSEWNEFKCEACPLELINKEHIENHYSERLNKEGEIVQELDEDKDLENCLHKEEDLEWNEFKCDTCRFEFTGKEHLKNHYSECPKREEEFIQKLKEDNAGLVCSSRNEENIHMESYEQGMQQCDIESSYSRLNKNNDTCATDVKTSLAQGDDKGKNCKCAIYQYSTHLEGYVVKHMCICNDEKSLKCHIYDETVKERPFKCDTCEYAAARKSHLKSHILAKHSNAEKQHRCADCEYSSYRKRDLAEHRRIHANEKQFKCDMCDYAATRKFYLNYHKLNHSNADKRYKCSDCKYSTYLKTNLANHMRTHTKERPFKCDMCDYAAALKATLKEHILVKHSKVEFVHPKERSFKCDACEYAAIRKSHLKNHILTRHSNAEKGYKCGNCEYSSYGKKELLNHMHKQHTNERQFKCDSCDYATVRKCDLKSHILVKHSNLEKPYKCNHCEWSTHLKSYLVKHERIHITPYRCDMCNYATIDKENLKLHISSEHSNTEKRYKCADCKYSTNIKAVLIIHKRTHTKERPFKCDTCEFATARRGTLNFHILTKHSNAEKQYKCGYCKYSTHIKQCLLNHERIHTKERPFKCSICDYAATQRITLTVHISRRHSEAKKCMSAEVANVPLKEKSIQYNTGKSEIC